ncbi:MAG: septal ring lytic transglycosylase RlpA family protein [Methylocella sp.]
MKNIIIVTIAFIAFCGAAQAQSCDRQGFLLPRTRLDELAHRSLPFGTHVLVTNLSNNRSAVLVVNDRGPFVKDRIIDVSTGAADVLGRRAGVARVTVETVAD